ncbi:MAG: DinB family protein [Gemmatimonadota bacterium]|nr:DinB family protein [Gemmatimonadota bacterium]
MTQRKVDLTELLTFNDWATRLLFDSVGGLSKDQWTKEVGGSFRTIQGTMAHMVGAEWIWLERWRGRSPTSSPEWLSLPDAAELEERWEALAAERASWLTSCPESELEAALSYRRLNGEPGFSRLELLVRHVVNHSTYHRGQVVAFLRTLGKAPPSTDLVLWDRLR